MKFSTLIPKDDGYSYQKINNNTVIIIKWANTENCQYFHIHKGWAFTQDYVDEIEQKYTIAKIAVFVSHKQVDANCPIKNHQDDITAKREGWWYLPYDKFIQYRINHVNNNENTKRGNGRQYVVPNFFMHAQRPNDKDEQRTLQC
jgi:hypothetical protein